METIDFNDVIRDPETISVVGGLLGINEIFKTRGAKSLSENMNIVQLVQTNIGSMKVGIYLINGTSPSNILTEWGRLLIFSENSVLFIGLNSKDLLVLSKDSIKWHYTILKGESVVGPF